MFFMQVHIPTYILRKYFSQNVNMYYLTATLLQRVYSYK